MADHENGEITRLLQAAGRGSREAVDRLLPLVYDELRCLARSSKFVTVSYRVGVSGNASTKQSARKFLDRLVSESAK